MTIKSKFFVSIFFLFTACSSEYSERSFQFNYEMIIESTDGNKLEIWIPVPQSNQVQTISNLTFDTNGLPFTVKKEDTHHNKYLYIKEDLGTNKSMQISMQFEVQRYEHGNEYFKNVNPENYLGEYRMVPTGAFFSSIIAENQLTKNKVKDIYNFVLSGMHYGKPKHINDVYYNEPWLKPDETYGHKQVSRDEVVHLFQKANRENGEYTFGKGNSLYACDIGVGNCTDYHSYFMSLGRTLEIPVRFHMGFSIPKKAEGSIGGYHCWADYYLEGVGWVPVDISEADKDSTKTDYYFGTLDQNRVEMMVGRDFNLEGHENKFVNFFIYPLVEINDKPSTNFSKSFYYKQLH